MEDNRLARASLDSLVAMERPILRLDDSSFFDDMPHFFHSPLHDGDVPDLSVLSDIADLYHWAWDNYSISALPVALDDFQKPLYQARVENALGHASIIFGIGLSILGPPLAICGVGAVFGSICLLASAYQREDTLPSLCEEYSTLQSSVSESLTSLPSAVEEKLESYQRVIAEFTQVRHAKDKSQVPAYFTDFTTSWDEYAHFLGETATSAEERMPFLLQVQPRLNDILFDVPRILDYGHYMIRKY